MKTIELEQDFGLIGDFTVAFKYTTDEDGDVALKEARVFDQDIDILEFIHDEDKDEICRQIKNQIAEIEPEPDEDWIKDIDP